MTWTTAALARGRCSAEDVGTVFNPPPKTVAIDTETPTVSDQTLLGFAIAVSPREAYYFTPESPYIPWHVLRDPNILKVFHNAWFDMEVLEPYGLNITNIGDTMVLAKLAGYGWENLQRKHMTPMSLEYLAAVGGHVVEGMGYLLKREGVKAASDLGAELVAHKCLVDATATLGLWDKLVEKVPDRLRDLDMRLLPLLFRAGRKGLQVDQEAVDALGRRLLLDLQGRETFFEALGFNPNSAMQVGEWLVANRGLRLPRTKKSRQYATGEAVLEPTGDAIAEYILDYRKVKKEHSTYVNPLLGLDRVYTTYHLMANTGRVSSRGRKDDPQYRALMNTPKHLRGVYVPDNGVFTDFDLSQIELIVLAHLAQDEVMLKVFEEGRDFHAETQELIGQSDRVKTKIATFATIYGGAPQTIAHEAGISVRQAEALRDRFSTARSWIRETEQHAVRHMEAVTMLGRRLRLPYGSADKLKRDGVSYRVQGSAAEILKKLIWECRRMDIRVPQHDQLVLDGWYEIPKELEWVAGFRTPFEVKYTKRWT